MSKRQLKASWFCFVVWFAFALPLANAAEDTFDFNTIVVDGELYLWNRISDILDLARGGLAGGPGLGAEVAVTEYVQLGAYACYERGVTFPHFVIPFWLVDYYERNEPIFISHEGRYATAVFGPWRTETKIDVSMLNRHFPRNKWDVRAQLSAAVLHAYVAVSPTEFWDLLAGVVGGDPSGDDERLDYVATRYPADQFGRGVCNILFGVFEIPVNMLRVTASEGDLPGMSKGLGLGVWRFLCREVVGVVEFVTFPFGWQPIIEPEYIFPVNQNATWRVYKPSFHKQY
ncbi:MAG: exosortase system-associated protein, TIGR04073 family [Lentisphaeria bacterium]